MDEIDLAQPCAVSFWRFAGAVIAGNLAAIGIGALAGNHFKNDATITRKTAMTFAKIGTFWLVAGGTWVFLNRKNGAST